MPSMTKDQPTYYIYLRAVIDSDVVAHDTQLSLYSRLTFSLGTDADISNIEQDPPVFSHGSTDSWTWHTTTARAVYARVLQVHKDSNIPSPTSHHRQDIYLDVAEGIVINQADITVTPPPKAVYVETRMYEPTISEPGTTQQLMFEPIAQQTFDGSPITARFTNVRGSSGAGDGQISVRWYIGKEALKSSPTLEYASPMSAKLVLSDPSFGTDTTTATLPYCDISRPLVCDSSYSCDAGTITAAPSYPNVCALKARPSKTWVSGLEGASFIGGESTPLEFVVYAAEYFDWANIEIKAELPDGMRIDTTREVTAVLFTKDENTGVNRQTAINNILVTVDNSDIGNDVDSSTSGVQKFTLDISAALQANGIPSGRITTPPVSGPNMMIKYYATILDEYTDKSPKPTYIRQGDKLWHTHHLNMTAYDNNQQLIASSQPASFPAVVTMSLEPRGDVYAVNSALCNGQGCPIRAGDEVTVRVQYDMMTSDFANFKLNLYLPVPLLDASQLNTAFPGTSTNGLPDNNHLIYGPDDTLHTLNNAGIKPTVSVAGTGKNVIVLEWADYSAAGSAKTLVDLLFTLTVSDKPFSDAQQASVILQVEEGDPKDSGVANLPFILYQPKLTVSSAWVGASRQAVTYTPAVPTGWVFKSLTDTGCPSWTQADLINIPASSVAHLRTSGDKVRGFVLLDNTGSEKAYGVRLVEEQEAGITLDAGTLCVNDANTGAVLTHTGDLFSASGLTLSSEVAAGQKIIITYQAQVSNGGTDPVLATTSKIEAYSSQAGGSNHVDGVPASQVTSHRTVSTDRPIDAATLSAPSSASTGQTIDVQYTLEDVILSSPMTSVLTIPSSDGQWSAPTVTADGITFKDAGGNVITDKNTLVQVQGDSIRFNTEGYNIINAPRNIVISAKLKVVQTSQVPITIDAHTSVGTTELSRTNAIVQIGVVSPQLQVQRVIEPANGALTGAGIVETGRTAVVVYTLSHTSGSSADAYVISLEDTLTSALFQTTGNPSGVTVSSDGKKVTLSLSSLAKGSTHTFRVPILAPQEGSSVTRDSRLSFKAGSQPTDPDIISTQSNQALLTVVGPELSLSTVTYTPPDQTILKGSGSPVKASVSVEHQVSSTAAAKITSYVVSLPSGFTIQASDITVSSSPAAVVTVDPSATSFTVTWADIPATSTPTVDFIATPATSVTIGQYNFNQTLSYSSGYASYSSNNELVLAQVVEAPPSPPQIVAYRASDPDNGDVVYSDGDILEIVFDSATNKPAIDTSSDINALFDFSGAATPAVYYRGTWSSDGTIATIRLLDTSGVAQPPVIGTDTVSTKVDVASGLDSTVKGKSLSAALTGDWGRKDGPTVQLFEAVGNQQSGYQAGDQMVLIFDGDTNQPDVSSPSAIGQFLSFSQSLGPLYTGTWSTPRRLTISVVSAGSGSAPELQVTTASLTGTALTNADGTSGPARGSAILSGSWGTDPVVCPVTGGSGGGGACPTCPTCPSGAGGSAVPLIVNATVAGDDIWIRFDSSTNQPTLGAKSAVDSVFRFNHVIGADYSGTWLDSSTAKITITDPAGARPISIGEQEQGVTVIGGLTHASGGSASTSYATMYTWNTRKGPEITRVVASDPDNQDHIFGPDDVISVYFDQPTSRPPMPDPKAVDQYIRFNLPSGFGHTYSGAWSTAGDRLDITIIAANSGIDTAAMDSLRNATRISQLQVLWQSKILRADGKGMYGYNASPVTVTGSWGKTTTPSMIGLVAANPGSTFAAGSTLTLIFDAPTNKPPVTTPAQLMALFGPHTIIPSTSGQLRALQTPAPMRLPLGDYTAAWSSDGVRLVITVVDPAGVSPPRHNEFALIVVDTSLQSGDGTSDPIPVGTVSPPMTGTFYGASSVIGGGSVQQCTGLEPKCTTFLCKYWWLVVLALMFLAAGLILLICHSRKRAAAVVADKPDKEMRTASTSFSPVVPPARRQLPRSSASSLVPMQDMSSSPNIRSKTLAEQDRDLQAGLRSLSNLSSASISTPPHVRHLPPLSSNLSSPPGPEVAPPPGHTGAGRRRIPPHMFKPKSQPSSHIPPPPSKDRVTTALPALNHKAALPSAAPPPHVNLPGPKRHGKKKKVLPPNPKDDEESTPLVSRNMP
eukprot:TRINITY_DN1377_c0_g1_i1.p1 TRINITY_DN1377_c0_g1~~TRINITY_DN1377_c0_g1_i1.p1  ORF type:complete len:2112 (-),score=502.77 TRINITY_DN1377_c0_g1_i1:52-6387(-)